MDPGRTMWDRVGEATARVETENLSNQVGQALGANHRQSSPRLDGSAVDVRLDLGFDSKFSCLHAVS